MNKSLLVGAVLGAVGVTAGGAVATYSLVKSGPEYAQVLAVQPVKTQIKTPREVCKDVTVTRQRPVQDQHQIAGTVVGALAGGLLGNQIGGASCYKNFCQKLFLRLFLQKIYQERELNSKSCQNH